MMGFGIMPQPQFLLLEICWFGRDGELTVSDC